jgi:transposase InsO family protein
MRDARNARAVAKPLGNWNSSFKGYTFRRRSRDQGVRPFKTSGKEIFNTDQGSQVTGAAFTGVLADNGIAISMDGKGAWLDNLFVERLWRSVKYEEV